MNPSTAFDVLCFRLGVRWFGLEAQNTLEVIGDVILAPIPGTPSHFLGMIGLHGKAVAVLDLLTFLGLGSELGNRGHTDDELARILVVKSAGMTYAIRTDAVSGLEETSTEALRQAQFSGETQLRNITRGEFGHAKRVITLLDAEQLAELARVQ